MSQGGAYLLKRKISEKLKKWRLSGRDKCLIVEGARQVGKTFAIRTIGKEIFEHVIEINFLEQPDAVELFSRPKSAEEILMRISAFTSKKMIPGKTLIFFDEVQECDEMVTAIKFLVDEGSYRYVMSGSLLGVELKDLRSVPVGYMGELEMYPLDLEEFAKALGVSNEVMNHLKECFDKQTPVDEIVHQKMLELVTLYMIVGGMPAAVQKYLDTNNLRSVLNEQRDIIRTYKRDITRYEKERKLIIEEIYNLIPSELNAKNKRFILKELNEKARFARYESGFLWLKDAGVAIPTYNVEAPTMPLLLNKQRNLFKLFLNDVGLLTAMYGGNIQVRLLNNQNTNYGAAYENLVTQELYAHGFAIDHDLFYFNSKKQGELDFVVEHQGEVLPIEVKSGKDYERHRALSNIMDNEEYAIPKALVFCQENTQTKDRLVYLPIYMTMFLQHENNDELTYQIDLTGLK